MFQVRPPFPTRFSSAKRAGDNRTMLNFSEFCMPKNIHGIGVGLTTEGLEQLDRYALDKGISRSEAARVAIMVGLPLLRLGIAINGQRALTILEHTQLALSLIVERQWPEDSDELIRVAMRNVREHHS